MSNLANRDYVVGDDPAFSSDHETHHHPFNGVVVSLVQQIYGTQGCAETQRGAGSLPCGPVRHKGAHQWISFAQTLIQTALRGDGIGGDESREYADIYFVPGRPERLLAGGIGQRRSVIGRETLGAHSNTKQDNREQVSHLAPEFASGESVTWWDALAYGSSGGCCGLSVRVTADGRQAVDRVCPGPTAPAMSDSGSTKGLGGTYEGNEFLYSNVQCNQLLGAQTQW
jgi:hypothetical protein